LPLAGERRWHGVARWIPFRAFRCASVSLCPIPAEAGLFRWHAFQALAGHSGPFLLATTEVMVRFSLFQSWVVGLSHSTSLALPYCLRGTTGLRGSSFPACVKVGRTLLVPHCLCCFFEDAFLCTRSFSLSPSTSPEGLVSGHHVPDCSLGVSKDRPSVDMRTLRPLRADCSEEPSALGSRLPSCKHVPSLPFFPASTVCSARSVAGLLHPAADHGVRHVCVVDSRRPPRRRFRPPRRVWVSRR